MIDKPPSDLWFMSLKAQANSCRWFGDSTVATSLPHIALSLCGSAGSLADIVKKLERGDLDPKDAHVHYDLTMELSKVFLYVLNVAALLKIDLLRAYEQKVIQNEKNFVEEQRKRAQITTTDGWRRPYDDTE